MRYLLFLGIVFTTGCVIPIGIPSAFEQPSYENLDEVAVVHVYRPSSYVDESLDLEILVDEKMGRELENGEISVKVSPGNHTVTLGDYRVVPAGNIVPVLFIDHNEVTKPVEKYFYPGETYYIRYKRSPKWSERLSYPDLQVTNKQMYDVEFALFRGLKTYDAVQKVYVQENCNLDLAKFQNSKINTPSNPCGSIPSFDFYVQALEEVHSNSFEWDVWDMAFDEVRGDQNKQLAKYIELRTDQLHAEKAGKKFATSLSKQTILYTQPFSKLNLTGTYISEITGKKDRLDAKRNGLTVTMEQNGNKVKGTFGSLSGEIEGTVDGNTITFDWYSSWTHGKGKWEIKSGSNYLTGSWKTSGGYEGAGKWNLKKIK